MKFEISFNMSSGDYINQQIKSLADLKFPNQINGPLYLSRNLLTDLVGLPQKIKGDLYADNNNLTTMLGIPEHAHNIYMDRNKITKIEFFPKKVSSMVLYSNEISNLKGIPNSFDGNLYVEKNKLTSLEGVPEKVNILNVNDNPLRKIDFIPKKIKKFDISGCEILDLSPIVNSEIYIMSSSYYRNMALLPIIYVKKRFEFPLENFSLNCLVKKYIGNGVDKNKIIDFQYNLMENGFESNAVWSNNFLK